MTSSGSMTRRLTLPFLTDGPTSEPDGVPLTFERRRLFRLRFLFVTAWIVIGVALAVSALVTK